MAAPNPIRNLQRTYVLVGVADGSLLTFVPLLLFQRGLTAAQIGVVLAAISACTLVAGLLWGYLVDRGLPAERMMVAANAGAVLLAMALAFAGSALALAAVIVALYVARSPMTLLDPVTLRRLRTTPRTDWARIRLRMSAGWAASVILAGALFQTVGLRLIPFVYAPLAALLGFWILRHVKASGGTQAPLTGGALLAPAPSRGMRIPLAMAGFMFSLFLVGAALSATQNFLTVQINVLGGGAFLIGAAAAFQALTEIPTMGYTHVLMRHASHKVLFAAGCVIYVLIFIAWAYTGNAVVAALLKLAGGVAFALTLVSGVLITEELSPPHLRATGQALMKSVMFGLAPIFGAIVGGFLYSAAGARVMFLTSTALMVVAGALVLVAVPVKARQPAPSRTAEPAIPDSKPALQPVASTTPE